MQTPAVFGTPSRSDGCRETEIYSPDDLNRSFCTRPQHSWRESAVKHLPGCFPINTLLGGIAQHTTFLVATCRGLSEDRCPESRICVGYYAMPWYRLDGLERVGLKTRIQPYHSLSQSRIPGHLNRHDHEHVVAVLGRAGGLAEKIRCTRSIDVGAVVVPVAGSPWDSTM